MVHFPVMKAFLRNQFPSRRSRLPWEEKKKGGGEAILQMGAPKASKGFVGGYFPSLPLKASATYLPALNHANGVGTFSLGLLAALLIGERRRGEALLGFT